MKKHLSRFFALVLSIIFAFPTVFAAHPMSDTENYAFTCKLMGIIEKFYTANQESLEKMSASELNTLKDLFSDSNARFDAEHSLCKGGTGTVQTAMKACHKHVSDPEALAKMPLSSRGLSMFILQEMQNMGVNCKYVHLFRRNLITSFVENDHNVVIYQRANGRWYVCDFDQALGNYIGFRRFGIGVLVNLCLLSGLNHIEDFFSIPLESYKAKFVCKDQTIIMGIPQIGIARTFWREFELTPEFLAKSAYDAFNHYEPLTPNELEKYYGVKTLDEAKALIKGKTLEEIFTLVYDRINKQD